MPTMKDIADQLGISINAVSLALNNKTGISEDLRMQILHIADSIGYIRKKEKYMDIYRKTNLCVMMQKIYYADMDFYYKLLYSVTGEAANNGYDSIVHFFDDDTMTVPIALESSRVAGIIVIGKLCDANLGSLLSYNIPIVLVDHASLSTPVNAVITDNKSGGYLAAKHLFDKGFRNIGFFGDLNYSLSIKERYFGFMQAVNDMAPEIMETIIASSITEEIEKFVLANNATAIAEILKKKFVLPHAYVCSNDHAAIALHSALRSLNKEVPQDISLIGFDDIAVCNITIPHLTSIKVDIAAMGTKAAKKLIHLIKQNDKTIETIVMGVSLVERTSVGTPPIQIGNMAIKQ